MRVNFGVQQLYKRLISRQGYLVQLTIVASVTVLRWQGLVIHVVWTVASELRRSDTGISEIG